MGNGDFDIEFKIDENHDRYKEVQKMFREWNKPIHKGVDFPLSTRCVGQTLTVKQIKSKTKWYHHLIPNLIWNKFMVKNVQQFEDCHVTSVDFIPHFHFCNINMEYNYEKDK